MLKVFARTQLHGGKKKKKLEGEEFHLQEVKSVPLDILQLP